MGRPSHRVPAARPARSPRMQHALSRPQRRRTVTPRATRTVTPRATRTVTPRATRTSPQKPPARSRRERNPHCDPESDAHRSPQSDPNGHPRGTRTVTAWEIARASAAAAIQGHNYSVWRSRHRVRHGGGWRTFGALSAPGRDHDRIGSILPLCLHFGARELLRRADRRRLRTHVAGRARR